MSANRITVHVKGLKELRQAFRIERDRIMGAFAAALYAEALAADARAQEEDMAPWDTVRMKQSHYVSPPIEDGDALRCELGYGVDYSIFVHERTELRHPHGQAKWLQKTLGEIAQGYAERLGSKVRRAIQLHLTVSAIPATAPTSPKDVGGTKVLRLPGGK